jgi:hypothetical protein
MSRERWIARLGGSGRRTQGVTVTNTSVSQTTTNSAARAAFRRVTVLVGIYLTISVLTILAAIAYRDDPTVVNTAVWIRASIVVIAAALMFRFAIGAARGNARAYLRLRIVSAIMVVAIAVILAIPGDFPLWMKIEQAVCGAILLAVVVLANRTRLRSVFAAGKPVEARRAAA